VLACLIVLPQESWEEQDAPQSDQKWTSTAIVDYTGYFSTSYMRNLSNELRYRHLAGEMLPMDQPYPWYQVSFSGAKAIQIPGRAAL